MAENSARLMPYSENLTEKKTEAEEEADKTLNAKTKPLIDKGKPKQKGGWLLRNWYPDQALRELIITVSVLVAAMEKHETREKLHLSPSEPICIGSKNRLWNMARKKLLGLRKCIELTMLTCNYWHNSTTDSSSFSLVSTVPVGTVLLFHW